MGNLDFRCHQRNNNANPSQNTINERALHVKERRTKRVHARAAVAVQKQTKTPLDCRLPSGKGKYYVTAQDPYRRTTHSGNRSSPSASKAVRNAKSVDVGGQSGRAAVATGRASHTKQTSVAKVWLRLSVIPVAHGVVLTLPRVVGYDSRVVQEQCLSC